MLWLSLRSGFYGTLPLIIAMLFGLRPSTGMMLVPVIACLASLGLSASGIVIATVAKNADGFGHTTSLVLSPLFLSAGIFVPVTKLPSIVQGLAQANPLYHCVQLVRDVSLTGIRSLDILHTAALIWFAVGMWLIATRRLHDVLID